VTNAKKITLFRSSNKTALNINATHGVLTRMLQVAYGYIMFNQNLPVIQKVHVKVHLNSPVK
jgi:hypothetical protein